MKNSNHRNPGLFSIPKHILDDRTTAVLNSLAAIILKSELKPNLKLSFFKQKAKQYIENNYFKEELSLEDVARDIKVSASYLSRVLKQETGTSFIDYLTQVRVKMAIQLMTDPSMKIYEIAERVGYNSQHYFSTAFKKVLGVSPVEYKKGGR